MSLSTSYGNAISLGMSPDETVQVVRRTTTDSDRRITFDPQTRPGVSALLSTAALCLGESPEAIAERIGDSGSGALKQLTADAINDFLAGHRECRNKLTKDLGISARFFNAEMNEQTLEPTKPLLKYERPWEQITSAQQLCALISS